MKSKTFVCDTETTIEEVPRVWAWEALEVGDVDNPARGLDIESLVNWLLSDNREVYFHNLKFDVSYIMSWLFTHGFEHTEERNPDNGQFTSLISDAGVYYVVTIKSNGHICRLLDSYKLISMKAEDIAKAYKLDFRKLTINYDDYRPVGYEPTQHEWDYVHADVAIISQALAILFGTGMTKITQSSNALADYINLTTEKIYNRRFPELDNEVDKFCRLAYYGGSTQVNDLYKGKLLGYGRVYDVNSMYPWAMRTQYLPYGEPIKFSGKPDFDDGFLHITKFSCWFKLKPDHIPCIMGRHISRFKYEKFLYDSAGEIVELTLTDIDIKLMFEQYDIKFLTWHGGYKFKKSKSLFKDYIDKWYKVKEEATVSGNAPMRAIAKDMMNKLSGKFGVRPVLLRKIPYYDGRIKHRLSEKEESPSRKGYVPVIAYTTAYGRDKIIRGAQMNYERFVYMDTDSLHILGDDPPVGVEIDHTKLGAFDHEGSFLHIKALHAKCYTEQMIVSRETMESLILKEVKKPEDFTAYGDMFTYQKVTVAGLPSNCHKQVTFDNFEAGCVYTGKLSPKMKPTGILLTETTFTIKG